MLAIYINYTLKLCAHSSRVRLYFSYAAILLCSLLAISPAITHADKTYNIVLVTSSNSRPYISSANAVKNSIRKSESVILSTKTLTIEELYSKKSTLPKTTDLFVPIGRRALKETLKYSAETPVLASLVSEYDFEKLIGSQQNLNNANIGVIYIDQPLDRHLSFSRLAFPNSNNFGFIISSDNKNTIDKLTSLNDKNHYIEILNYGDNVISTLSHMLNNSDALIALPDPIVFNLRTTRSILLSTYRKRIPVIGFSKSYVKAGALAAIYSTPELIGKQTGEIITDLVLNTSPNNKLLPLPRQYSKYFSISVNNRVSRSLGLPALDPDSLRKKLLLIEARNHE